MRKQVFLAVLAAFFAGCSHNFNVGTFSVVSAHTITSPQRADMSSGERYAPKVG